MWDQNRWKIIPSAPLLITRIMQYLQVRKNKSKKKGTSSSIKIKNSDTRFLWYQNI